MYPWPATAAQARLELHTRGFVAISITTGSHVRREEARVWIRAAAGELLHYRPDAEILSISHVDALSIAVVGLPQKLGVDLAHVDQAPHDREALLRLTHDYLGPDTAHMLRACPENEWPLAFVKYWARWEAGLKCHGLELQEWTPALQTKVNPCDFLWLDLQPPLVGCLAIGNTGPA